MSDTSASLVRATHSEKPGILHQVGRSTAVGRPGVVLALCMSVVVLAGCGGKVIDHQGAERFIDQDLSSAGVEVRSVECPVGVEIESGVEFECEVVDERDEVALVKMRILDDEGTVRPVSIELAETGTAEVR